MRRSDQARLQIGLTFPGSGPVAGPAVAPPAAVSPARRWLDVRGMLTGVQIWNREHGLDRDHVVYWLALLACGVLFGLFVGGYVGFVQAATPPADLPYSYAQLATSDVQWIAKMRQYWSASHPLESAGQRARETHWQRLLKSAATDSGSGGTPSPKMLGGHFVRLDTPGFTYVKKAAVAR